VSEDARGTIFFTCVSEHGQVKRARLLLESLRAFGGNLSDSEFWVLEADPELASCESLAEFGAEVVPFQVAAEVDDYLFASKVSACAFAEARANRDDRGTSGGHRRPVSCLCWLIPECLVLRPPSFLRLSAECDVAVRPVHIRNVGLPANDEPDAFWRGVFDEVGEPDRSFTVRSFVDDERIRPYFNSAAFAFDPRLGLMRDWLVHFGSMVRDGPFQERACPDTLHRVFLHQAVLSALIAVRVERRRVRELPPEYGYPYNLHDRVPEERRVVSLDDTVLPIYEERPVDPRLVDDIGIGEPLRSWLLERTGHAER